MSVKSEQVETTSIRASSIPLAQVCAASQLVDEFTVASGGEAADLGSAVHKIWTERLAGRSIDVWDVASEYGVDRDELAATAGWLMSSWEKVAEWFPNPMTEVPLEWTDEDNGIRLTGTIDVLSDNEGELRLLDAKTGRLDMDHSGQLRAYAFLALNKNPDRDRVYAAVLHLRNRKFMPVSDGREHGYYYRDELERWWQDVAAHLKAEHYKSGSHCQYCRRSTTCPKIVGELVQAHRVLSGELIEGTAEEIAAIMPKDPAELGRLGGMMKDKLSLFTKRSDVWMQALKISIVAAGGEVETGDGRKLVVIDQIQHPLKATPESIECVQSLVAPEQIEDIMSISKGALEKAVKERCARGEKKAVWDKAMELFDEMQCVDTKIVQRLEIRRADAKQLEIEK